MDIVKRRRNEREFGSRVEQSGGGRRYWYEVQGRHGWKAQCIKATDTEENTVRFYQEIYDSHGVLVEIHQKYPIDTGHQRITRGG
jgi:hypothetical protein